MRPRGRDQGASGTTLPKRGLISVPAFAAFHADHPASRQRRIREQDMRQLDLTAIVSGSIVIVFFAFACWLLDDKPFDRMEATQQAKTTMQAKAPSHPTQVALAPPPPRRP